VAWSDTFPSSVPEQRQRKFDLLAMGVQVYPDELLLFDRMMKLTQTRDETTDAVCAFFQANIVEGRAVGLSHLLLGSFAHEQRDAAQAQFHLERAFEILPNADLVANNLAWLLAHAEPPELERALGLIDAVVQRNPGNPRFRDTRGQILLKLNRVREALS